MRINKHDTQGTKPLLSKGELGYDDYTAGGDTGRVYVGTGTENIALAERLESNMMTKAQFNALAEERKANRAGSGFEVPNSNTSQNAYWVNVQNGIKASTGVSGSASNQFAIGGLGDANDIVEKIVINGVNQNISYVASPTKRLFITLPTAPNIYPHDTVLTPEQIASGVIKHADASNSGLIVNGKFDTDTSGWASSIGFPATLSNVSGKLRVTATAPFGRAIQGFPTVVGKKYFIKGQKGLISGAATAQINLSNSSGSDGIVNVDNIGEFTATDTTTYVVCALTGGGSNGAVAEFDNIAVYPADAISRADLVFPESYHEDVAEKGVGYPFGNVQYLGGNTDGLTGIANGAFTGFEQYSLFGNWQTPSSLIGKGYVWSSLTEAQRKAFIANPENNCYLDGDKTIQVRYRVRVVQGWGDSWYDIDRLAYCISGSAFSAFKYSEGTNTYIPARGKKVSIVKEIGGAPDFLTFGYSADNRSLGTWSTDSTNTSVAYEGKCFALPLALVHRRNQGMYHNVYNPNGTKLASDGLDCFRTTISFTSTMDCFDPAKLLTASGYIGTVSGRPDGLFYDQVHESDIQDLRNSSKKVEDYNRLIGREFNKLVAGTYRGASKEIKVQSLTQSRATTSAATYITIPTGYRIPEGTCIYHNSLASRVLYQTGQNVYITPAINIVINTPVLCSVEF